MANVDQPMGLKAIRHRNGAPYTGSGSPYLVVVGNTDAMFVGDCVVRAGSSNTAQLRVPGGLFETGTLPTVDRATVGDGNPITGVILSFGTDPDALGKAYRPARTERLMYVCDDPDVIFEIQADGAIPAASIGLNAVLIDDASGSTVTSRSGTELDTSNDVPAADASNQLTILRAINREGEDTTLTNANVEVRINNHTEANGVAGID